MWQWRHRDRLHLLNVNKLEHPWEGDSKGSMRTADAPNWSILGPIAQSDKPAAITPNRSVLGTVAWSGVPMANESNPSPLGTIPWRGKPAAQNQRNLGNVSEGISPRSTPQAMGLMLTALNSSVPVPVALTRTSMVTMAPNLSVVVPIAPITPT
ncbi:hypothetical protein BDK51DRAFT_29879 [Blyttiomyces helicus]|uniref:Uncharacterized protein n=1 Tax=Blyttiomyces helicus TaxID=388810 RepID=A0A4P9WRQ9_9FUNG|nr:hypothetical protein BDK51DRAFT_29879 [Blyttiomyces helicus]|eukprot:RKO93980.1 hypothetical protein BDK51DRAFT_29879 [Blyttiomyces helicus]